MKISQNTDYDDSLLARFNSRDEVALGEVYKRYYRELIFFTKRLYWDTNIEARDVVHDVLLKIWESKEIQFKKLDNIKAYIYVSVKNNFLDYLIHNKRVDKFNQSLIADSDNFVSQIVLSEALSSLAEIKDFIPADTAEIFRLMIDGWSIKEIASTMRLSPSSIYTKKNEAIKILKKKFPNKILYILLSVNNL